MSEEVKKDETLEEETVVELEEEQSESEDAEIVEEEVESEPEESKDEEELEQYSDRVQKRIATLTRRLREAERASESAYSYATQLQDENKSLKAKSEQSDKHYLSEAENRLKSQKAQTQLALKGALEEQDYEKVAKAQDVLAKIAVEESKIESSKSQLEYQEEQKSQEQQVSQPVEQPQMQVPEPLPQLDEKTKAWAEKNEWFGVDEILTNAAFTIHNQLLTEAFDPKSDEYYTEIDKRLRARFPNDFSQEENSKKPTQRVASAGRADTSAKAKKKQVRLTPSEVKMAKSLNVPLSEYAKFVKR